MVAINNHNYDKENNQEDSKAPRLTCTVPPPCSFDSTSTVLESIPLVASTSASPYPEASTAVSSGTENETTSDMQTSKKDEPAPISSGSGDVEKEFECLDGSCLIGDEEGIREGCPRCRRGD